ncbi:MAG: hypothetical protein ACYDER_23815 [Ktedonobacteraceae bacterium]
MHFNTNVACLRSVFVQALIELQELTTSYASSLSSNTNGELFIYVFGAVLFPCICYSLALLAIWSRARRRVLTGKANKEPGQADRMGSKST